MSSPAVAPPKAGGVITAIDVGTYAAQLEAKKALIEAQFAEFLPPPWEVFESAPEHYRMR